MLRWYEKNTNPPPDPPFKTIVNWCQTSSNRASPTPPSPTPASPTPPSPTPGSPTPASPTPQIQEIWV